ncbi:MAG: isoprenylcysteine carboxylmethyltransferase family protein [Acidobacteriota bacterium]
MKDSPSDTQVEKENNLKLKIGNLCFRFRAISIVPVILICLFFFKPPDLGKYNMVINIAGFIIAISGGLLRMISVGYSKPATSGRENFLTAENLNTTGTYSVVRNPLYVGVFLIYNGVLVTLGSIPALILLNIFLVFNYHFIILAEEEYLKKEFGKEYLNYMNNVPRMIPNLFKYKKSDMGFSLKKVMLREKNTTFYWLTFYIIVLLIKQYTFNDGAIFNFWWYGVPALVLLGVNLVLTIYKKYFVSKEVYT